MMARTFKELIEEYNNDSSQWEVSKIEVKESTNRRNRGGKSIQELLKHKKTGEELVRHTLVKPDGSPLDSHFRPMWK